MVSNNTNKQNGEHEYKGLSTDTKPTSCAVNSIFLELDTGLFYYFDGEEWQEMISGGGGGGTNVVANPSGTASEDLTKLQVGNEIYGIPSGGGIGMFKVNFTYDPEEQESPYTCDKTYEEIKTAYDSGNIILGYCNDYNAPSISVVYIEEDDFKAIVFNFLDVFIEDNYNEHAYNTLVITEDNSILHSGNAVRSSVPNP